MFRGFILNKKIGLVTGIPGSGKSHSVVQKLIQMQNSSPDIYLFASKTIRLSAANFRKFKASGLNCIRVDSESYIDDEKIKHTLTSITNIISSNEPTVIFTTHKSTIALDEAVLQHVKVIFDEVPQDATQFINVSIDSESTLVKDYCDLSTSPNHAYGTARLKAKYRDVNHPEYSPYIKNIIGGAKGADITSYTEEFITILEFLLEDYAALYQIETLDDGNSVYNFYAVHYMPAIKMLRGVKAITILASNLKDSIFAHIATNLLGCTLEPINLGLPVKYKKKLRIVPYLLDGDISAKLKKSLASEKLHDVTEAIQVKDHFQLFADSVLEKEYLLFINKKDTLCPDLSITGKNLQLLNTAVHGLNDYDDYTKAAFTASLRPTPIETNIITCMANDLGLDADEFIKVILTERMYETCLQCIMRLGIRKLYDGEGKPLQDDTEYTVVVPDMAHAKYIAGYFEDGYCTIDTSNGMRSSSSVSDEEKQNLRYIKVCNILRDKANKVGSMPEILAKHDVPIATFNRMKKDFKAELIAEGLLKERKPKAKK